MKPFFILGLPRSRTCWLANLFTYSRSICYHEPSKHFSKIEDLKALFEISKKPYQGASDSTLTLFHEEINEMFDNPPIVVIDRDYREVLQSLGQVGIPNSIVTETIYHELQKIKEYPNAMVIPFNEMNEKTLSSAWNHCMEGEKFDHLRWAELEDQIIEHNMIKTRQIIADNLGRTRNFVFSAKCFKGDKT